MIHTESIRQEHFHWHIEIQSVRGLETKIIKDGSGRTWGLDKSRERGGQRENVCIQPAV